MAELHKDSASQWNGNAPAAAQGGRVEPGREPLRGREGSLDASCHISDYVGRNAQLAIGKVLEEHGPEKRIVGTFDPDHDRGTQTRTEIVELDLP